MPNVGASSFIKQKLLYLKAQIGSHKIIMGDFNTPLSPIDRLSGQKKNQKRKLRNKVHYKPNELNRHLQSISFSTIHTLFSSSWNFLQNR
jgi:hypothetical protein